MIDALFHVNLSQPGIREKDEGLRRVSQLGELQINILIENWEDYEGH